MGSEVMGGGICSFNLKEHIRPSHNCRTAPLIGTTKTLCSSPRHHQNPRMSHLRSRLRG